MIVDWINGIQTIITGLSDKDSALGDIEKDLDNIIGAIYRFDTVIIRLYEGIRLEIQPEYQQGAMNIRTFTKDFNEIKEYNELINKKNEIEQELLDAVKTKNDPELLRKTEEFIKLKNEPQWLFSINIVMTEQNKSRVEKAINTVPRHAVKSYILGFLKSLGIEPENKSDS